MVSFSWRVVARARRSVSRFAPTDLKDSTNAVRASAVSWAWVEEDSDDIFGLNLAHAYPALVSLLLYGPPFLVGLDWSAQLGYTGFSRDFEMGIFLFLRVLGFSRGYVSCFLGRN